MGRTIHCTVIEVPVMNEPGEGRGFEDLVPWADPYIAALIEKLRHADDECECEVDQIVDELPPPLENDDDDTQIEWRSGRSPRNEPQE